MNAVLLGAGVVAVLLGVVLVVRPDRTAEYQDTFSAGGETVPGEFGVAVSRINGVLFVLVGLWLAWTALT